MIVETDGFEFPCGQDQREEDRRRTSAAGAPGDVTLRLIYTTIMACEEAILREVLGFMVGVARSPLLGFSEDVEILRKRLRL